MKRKIFKIVSTLLLVLTVLATNISPVLAKETNLKTTSNPHVISQKKYDVSNFLSKTNNIESKNDISNLSYIAYVKESEQQNGLIQYVIQSKKPSLTICYSDGTSENQYEVVGLLAANSVETTPKENSETHGNLDVLLKVTLAYTEKQIEYGYNYVKAGRFDYGKCKLVSNAEHIDKNLMVTIRSWGEIVDPDTGNYLGFSEENGHADLLQDCSVGDEVIADVTTGRSKYNFLDWYNLDTSWLTIEGSVQYSRNGTNWIEYKCSFGVGNSNYDPS